MIEMTYRIDDVVRSVAARGASSSHLVELLDLGCVALTHLQKKVH
jgi:hypothetical protein